MYPLEICALDKLIVLGWGWADIFKKVICILPPANRVTFSTLYAIKLSNAVLLFAMKA